MYGSSTGASSRNPNCCYQAITQVIPGNDSPDGLPIYHLPAQFQSTLTKIEVAGPAGLEPATLSFEG